MPSLSFSPGFWGSPEFDTCRLRVVGGGKYRSLAVVSSEGSVVESAGDEQVRVLIALFFWIMGVLVSEDWLFWSVRF